MPPISAVIISKNEEKHIGACIRSLQGVVDEVLVLDSQSMDRTVPIAGELGARVLDMEWKGYSATKNEGNRLARHDWILSLDADEQLSEELRQSILKEKDHLEGAYSFPRLNHYGGKPIRCCGWYPDEKPRLFHREEAHWVGDFVHEELKLKPGVKEGRLKGDLLHFTYSGPKDHRQRAKRYSDLAAQEIAKSQKGALGLRKWGSSVARFFKMYFLQGGIFAGKSGYQISRITSQEVWMKYDKAMRLRRKH